MKNSKVIPGLKGRKFNGNPALKIKRIRQEPRHKIRQLLHSFTPLNQPVSETKNRQKSQP